jgi:hypothetical protein
MKGNEAVFNFGCFKRCSKCSTAWYKIDRKLADYIAMGMKGVGFI